MNIFSLDKEELFAISQSKELLEQFIIETKGFVISAMEIKNVSVDLNILFRNNELNLDVFINSYAYLNNSFEKLNKETVLTLSSLVTVGSNKDYEDISNLFNKLIAYCKDYSLTPLSLNEVNVATGFGKNKQYSKNKNIPFFNPLDIKEKSISEIKENQKIEKPYEYEKESYYGDEDDEEEEQNPINQKIEEQISTFKKSKLKKPYSYKRDIYSNLHNSLYSKELNKDDMDLVKYEPKISEVNDTLLKSIKDNVNEQNSVILNFVLNLFELENNDIKTLYLMLSNGEALTLLKNKELLVKAAEITANLSIYKDLKDIEGDFFDGLENLFYENIEKSVEKRNPWKEEILNKIKDTKVNRIISEKDINELDEFIPTNVDDVEKLLLFIPELINRAQENLNNLNNSMKLMNWRKDLTEYCELTARKMIMTAIEVSELNTNDLMFIREQVSLTENKCGEILDNNISEITLGISHVINNRAPYSSMKTIFNNDKTLLLKDLYLDSINKPAYDYDDVDYSSTYKMLVKYTNPEEVYLREPIVISSFKYLTRQEALSLNYQGRFYFPESDSSNYTLTREHDEVMSLPNEEIIKLLKMQKNNIVFNSNKSMEKKIKAISKKISLKEIMDADIAEILVKEIFSITDSNSHKHFEAIAEHLDINKVKNNELNRFYTNDLISDIVRDVYDKEGKISISKNNRRLMLVDIFEKLLRGEDVSNIDLREFSVHVPSRESALPLIALNVLIKKYEEKDSDKEKLNFVLALSNKLSKNLLSYECLKEGRKNISEDIIIDMVKMSLSLDKYGIKPITLKNEIIFLLKNDYLSTTMMEKLEGIAPKTDDEYAIFNVKQRLSHEFFNMFKENNQYSSQKIVDAMINNKMILDKEEVDMFIDVNEVKKMFETLLTDLSPELTWEILSEYSLEKFGINNWNKGEVIKKIFESYFGERMKELKMYGEDFNKFYENEKISLMIEDLKSLSKQNEITLEDIKGVEKNVKKNQSPKDKILYKISQIEKNHFISEEQYELLEKIEILGSVSLSSEEKREVIDKGSILYAKYKILAEQSSDVFHVDFPHEEVFALFKDSVDTAEKVSLEIQNILKGSGWSNKDLFKLDFSTLRLKSYRRSMGDTKKVELEKVVNQVFDKHYSKERLLENPMLRYPLNNQIFKFIFNTEEQYEQHEKFLKETAMVYLEEKYSNANQNFLLTISEFELNANMLLKNKVKRMKFNNFIKNTVEINENAEFLLSFKCESERLCFPDYFFDNLNIDNLIDKAVKSENTDLLENLISLSYQNDLAQMLDASFEEENIEVLNRYKFSFTQKLNSLSKVQLDYFVDNLNEVIKNENVRINDRNNKVTERTRKKELIKEVRSIDDIFELFRKRDSWEIISKNQEMLESINQEAIIKRSERVFSNKIIKNVLKDFILNESVVDKDVCKQISSTSTNYYRKVTIPVDIKMELVEKLVDMKIDNKTKIENLERVLDLGDNESFIVSEKELNKLVKTYYSYKEHGGIRYLLAHLVLRKNISYNLGYLGLKDDNNKLLAENLNKDDIYAYGKLLFTEMIDIKELILSSKKLVEDNSAYLLNDLEKDLLHKILGRITDPNFDLDDNQNSLNSISNKLKNNVSEELVMTLEKTIKDKLNSRIEQLEKAEISLLPYASLSSTLITELDTYDEYMQRKSNEPILQSLLDIYKHVNMNFENELNGIKELIIRKMENSEVDELANLAKIIEQYSKVEKNYMRNSLMSNLTDLTKLKETENSNNPYQKLMNLCSVIQKNSIFAEIKAYERMNMIYGKMEDSPKSKERKRGKI